MYVRTQYRRYMSLLTPYGPGSGPPFKKHIVQILTNYQPILIDNDKMLSICDYLFFEETHVGEKTAAACSAVNKAWGPPNTPIPQEHAFFNQKEAPAAACSAVNNCWGYRSI